MINRILIRIKVIQILYSFLLVEKRFALEGSPSSPTKEKRFSYALYLDLLVLLVKIAASVERTAKDFPLLHTRFITRLQTDETFKNTLKKYDHEPFPLQGAVDSLAEKVKESGIYKSFLKQSGKEAGAGESDLWQNLLNLVIINDPYLLSLIEKRENYTLKGLERTRDMLNRTFVNFLASQENVREVEKDLQLSLDKARELYMRLLYLPVELTDLEERILDDNRHKFLKTEADINPNMRFVENRIIAKLRRNPMLMSYVEKNKISWLNDEPMMMRNLLKAIKESDAYRGFMGGPENNIHVDGEFWREIFKTVILENPYFLETLEEKSVFWNDDLVIMTTFVFKSLRRLEEDECEDAVLDKYKDREDERFGSELVRYLYRDKDDYRLLIDNAVEGGRWDKDRLAFMDIVIVETALAEILNFPKIPLQVSVNEYIELAKSYSTSKSAAFVHGVLGAIIARLQKEGKLLKR